MTDDEEHLHRKKKKSCPKNKFSVQDFFVKDSTSGDEHIKTLNSIYSDPLTRKSKRTPPLPRESSDQSGYDSGVPNQSETDVEKGINRVECGIDNRRQLGSDTTLPERFARDFFVSKSGDAELSTREASDFDKLSQITNQSNCKKRDDKPIIVPEATPSETQNKKNIVDQLPTKVPSDDKPFKQVPPVKLVPTMKPVPPIKPVKPVLLVKPVPTVKPVPPVKPVKPVNRDDEPTIVIEATPTEKLKMKNVMTELITKVPSDGKPVKPTDVQKATITNTLSKKNVMNEFITIDNMKSPNELLTNVPIDVKPVKPRKAANQRSQSTPPKKTFVVDEYPIPADGEFTCEVTCRVQANIQPHIQPNSDITAKDSNRRSRSRSRKPFTVKVQKSPPSVQKLAPSTSIKHCPVKLDPKTELSISERKLEPDGKKQLYEPVKSTPLTPKLNLLKRFKKLPPNPNEKSEAVADRSCNEPLNTPVNQHPSQSETDTPVQSCDKSETILSPVSLTHELTTQRVSERERRQSTSNIPAENIPGEENVRKWRRKSVSNISPKVELKPDCVSKNGKWESVSNVAPDRQRSTSLAPNRSRSKSVGRTTRLMNRFEAKRFEASNEPPTTPMTEPTRRRRLSQSQIDTLKQGREKYAAGSSLVPLHISDSSSSDLESKRKVPTDGKPVLPIKPVKRDVREKYPAKGSSSSDLESKRKRVLQRRKSTSNLEPNREPNREPNLEPNREPNLDRIDCLTCLNCLNVLIARIENCENHCENHSTDNEPSNSKHIQRKREWNQEREMLLARCKATENSQQV